MSVYLVTWDLNKEKPNYATARANFISRLNQYENVKDEGLDSVRFVSVNNWTSEEVADDLRRKLDKNDRLVVVKMTNTNHSGWLSGTVWDWINARL
jgi:hypothetical protein